MLTKDDPVYYKSKLKKLFKDAKDNGITIEITKDAIIFFDKETGERAGVYQ